MADDNLGYGTQREGRDSENIDGTMAEPRSVLQVLWITSARVFMPWRYRKTWGSVLHRMKLVAKALRRYFRNTTVKVLVLPRVYSPQLERYEVKKTDRVRPVFLVLRHRFFRGGERFGNSNEEHVISGPLRSAGVADVEHYYYDTDNAGGVGRVFNDQNLINRVLETRPDLIILSSHNPDDISYPQIEVLEAIRSQCGIPFVAMWADSTTELAFEHCTRMSRVIDLNLLLDSNSLSERNPGRPEFLRLLPPLDFSVFSYGDGPRDIPISFIGSTGDYRSIREDYLSYLSDHKVTVFREGGEDSPISLDRYAEILRKSKIALNFSHAAFNTHQLKGRVLEVMYSGAMLVEDENSETSQFFKPMIDYVSFDNAKDLADKLRYYTKHEEERQEIALNGHRKATTQYNYQTLWNLVMARLAEMNILTQESDYDTKVLPG